MNVVVTEVEIRLLEVTWTEDFLDIASNNNTKLVTDIRDEVREMQYWFFLQVIAACPVPASDHTKSQN